MRGFLDMTTGTSGGASLAGLATGQFVLAVLTFICFVIFGAWGAYIRWKDSRAFHDALNRGDFKEALSIRDKAR